MKFIASSYGTVDPVRDAESNSQTFPTNRLVIDGSVF